MKKLIPFIAFTLCAVIFSSCILQSKKDADPVRLANTLEESLNNYIIEPWYPRNIDTLYGGYISAFDYDWTLSKNSQVKALVQQARHVWTTSYIYEAYPERNEFLEYSEHGFRFLKDALWDQEFGGFHAYCNQDGTARSESMSEKRIYGQAFGIYSLSQYYRMSQNMEALELAKESFRWMEDHAHDKQHGGYFEFLRRDGSPILSQDASESALGDSPGTGLKDYNSSIHLMEALTELYRVWPDSLVLVRLEEMFFLIRDTFVHPDGYLQLYFYPDWKLVPEETMEKRSPEDHWYTQHFTYGHDVETAFLLLETAHVLGWEDDEKTHRIAKRLVDHSLESGWDHEKGGFFDAGKEKNGEIEIINRQKSWWGLVEGMNALLLMHTLYPEDPQDYHALFLKSWEHIDTYLIDKEYGGWYGAALDTSPQSKEQGKSHIWKTTYHNVRGMVNCMHLLELHSTQ